MRKNRVFGRWVAASGVATVVAIGCATTEAEDVIQQITDAGKPDAKVPVKDSATQNDTGAVVTPDAGGEVDANTGVDSGSGDGGLFAGETVDPSPELAEGATCLDANSPVNRRCGYCGTQQALCTPQANGTAIVGPYGACSNEQNPATACLPNGQRTNGACGLCGTRLQVCNASCQWKDDICEGALDSGCTAGSVRYLKLNCPGDQFARQVCTDRCAWPTPEACAPRAADELAIPATATAISTLTSTLWGTVATNLVAGACPADLGTATGNVQYTKIHNGGAADVKLNLWVTKSGSATLPATLISAYAGSTVPADDAGRQACVGVVASGATGLQDLTGVTVPAGGDIIVQVTGVAPATANAAFVLNAQLTPPPPATTNVVIPATVGTTSTTPSTILVTSTKLKRASTGTCPTSTTYTDKVNAVFFTLQNTTATAAVVDVGIEDTGSGDFMAAVYAAPPSDSTVTNCIGKSVDTCSDSVISSDACALDVNIPANGQVVLMVSNYSGFITVDKPFNLKITRQ